VIDVGALAALDIQFLGALALSLAVIALGSVVFLHNPRVIVNKRFALMSLITAGWIVAISFAVAAHEPSRILIWARIGFAFAAAIPFSMLRMVEAASSSYRPRPLSVFVPPILCVLFVLASFTPLIVVRAFPGFQRPHLVYGPLHKFFGVYFIICFVSGLYTLWRTLSASSGANRLRLRYLLLGIALTGIGATTTNLFIPLLWNSSRYSFLGPYFSLLFFSFSAHAIIRHRLLDTKIVIRRGVVYLCALLTSAFLFVLVADVIGRTAGYDRGRIPLHHALLAALGLAILFQPLKASLQRWLNKYVYREAYDYQRTVRDASRRLSTMLELDPLLRYLTSVIQATFRAESVAVYLRDLPSNGFTPRTLSSGDDSTSMPSLLPISHTSPLITHLEHHKSILVREEVRSPDELALTAAARALHLLHGDVALPLADDATILGVLIVGPKRSGDTYFADDIALIETLVSQAAVTIKNAQLYRQVVLVNEYVDNILSTMESGVIAVNVTGRISLFNPAAERLTLSRRVNVHGQSYACLPPALASPLREAFEARRPRSQFETSLSRPDGTSIPLVCSTTILSQRDGVTVTHGALIVFSDLTRLKELEREKRRAERLAAFGALASGVAHEIKNPLVAIRTFAELLPERFTDTEFREDFAKVVTNEIARIDDLVGRLRGIAATTPQQVIATDIREPIAATLTLLRAQLEQTRTTVTYNIQDSEPFVAVDQPPLKQLFLNLFLNAIEAMGLGGELLVRISRQDLHGASWVVVEVADTGPGIPDHVKARVFDPFFTTKSGGSGLGLAICRSIVDAHRGAIRVEDRRDTTGTLVIVQLPVMTDVSRTLAEPALHN
jgi:signal transduction histidine kinase